MYVEILKKIIRKNYHQNKYTIILKLDCFGGVYQLNHTLGGDAEPIARGYKKIKDRLTVVICSNAEGTHKLKLLLIGNSARPQALNNVKLLFVHNKHTTALLYLGS